jgi:DNA-binding HxlR family transcriptional regulator
MARYYNSMCPVARTLNIIGDRWAILILRDLFLKGPRKFQDFEQSLKGITPGVLSKRLKEFESHAVIEGVLYSEHPPRYQYQLTQKGHDLSPILRALRLWGERYR